MAEAAAHAVKVAFAALIAGECKVTDPMQAGEYPYNTQYPNTPDDPKICSGDNYYFSNCHCVSANYYH